MTERERLIELLNEVGGNLLKFPTENFIEAFADYLLKNGVTALPCKVGDTVYCIKDYLGFLPGPKAEKIGKIEIYDTDIFFKTDNRVFSYRAIGSTVFLSYEEAEKELRNSDGV